MAGYILGDSRGFRLHVIAALIVFGTFSSFSPIMGQQIVSAATLRGVVRDVAGNIVVGADITLRSRETNLSSNSTTDENGEFRFGYVPVGNYEILVDQPGYDSARRSFTATLGDELFIGIDMKIAGVTEAKFL